MNLDYGAIISYDIMYSVYHNQQLHEEIKGVSVYMCRNSGYYEVDAL